MNAQTSNKDNYGGFWRRVAAGCVDMLVLAPVIILIMAFFPATYEEGYSMDTFWLDMVWLIITIIYVYVFYTSKWQATPGYRALGMYITDASGKKVSGGQAVIRQLAEILSMLIMGIGYLMVAFTAKRQALHDIIAKTLVHRGMKN